ncbi:hypothetical protein LEP1GSC060_3610 [Leptospira weilii serovar Ranarum str. ICFT]|uniref:Uncharacterized protein n=1 Tax=Leptospira weilii serovar Ranarum str. ICFT TaxID=1218598 RepID=N1WJR6_9LEPT|nr:hypothetical protein LEP1GSC060_3610 [Leptospira weilii serovar Ranarum str. ICFT]
MTNTARKNLVFHLPTIIGSLKRCRIGRHIGDRERIRLDSFSNKSNIERRT